MSRQGLRALPGQYCPDHAQTVEVVDIFGLRVDLDDGNRGVRRGEMLGQSPLPLAELHPLRVHPQRRRGDRVARTGCILPVPLLLGFQGLGGGPT